MLMPARKAETMHQLLPLRHGVAYLRDEVVEVRDRTGRVLMRHDGAVAEIVATEALCIRADGDISIEAGGQLRLSASKLELNSDEATIVSRRLETIAQTLIERTERLEIHAGKLVERTRNSYRVTQELWQQRVGRVRTLVAKSYDLITERTSLLSRQETSVDGKRILLG